MEQAGSGSTLMKNGGILAPSTVGFVYREMFLNGRWRLKPNGNWIPITANPAVLMTNKSPTIKSDRKRPTDYTRMISKLIPQGAVKQENLYYENEWDNSPISLSAYPNGCDIPSRVVTVPQWMTDKVIREAKAELNQLEANILEDLGQLRQTASMIAEIVKVIFELYLACRKGNFGSVRKRLRDLGSNVPRSIANGWLMYFYGIKPLVSTIDALAASEKPLYRTYKSRKRTETSTQMAYYVYNGAGFQYSGTAKLQAQCELRADIKCDGNTRYWSKLGITSSSFTDAVVTAWALIPYSFVFDWFIPVEGWLRSLHWSPFLEYQGGYVGKRHVVRGDILDVNPFSTGGPYWGKQPRSKLQVLFYRREAYPLSVPPSYLSIRLSLTSTQIISAAALITQKG